MSAARGPTGAGGSGADHRALSRVAPDRSRSALLDVIPVSQPYRALAAFDATPGVPRLDDYVVGRVPEAHDDELGYVGAEEVRGTGWCARGTRKRTLRRPIGSRSSRRIRSPVGSRRCSDRLCPLGSSHEGALRQLLHPTYVPARRPAALEREVLPGADRQHGPEQVGCLL
jgi:hypothetical protein